MKRIVLLFLLLSLTACSSATTATEPLAVTVSPSLITSTTSPTSKSTESPTPSISAEYQDLQTLLDAQNAFYTLQNGKIVIDDYSTSFKENIVLNPESGKVIQTNDGLAKEIGTALDTDNNRMVYIKGYGWVKDVDPSQSTLDKRIKIPFSWAKDDRNVSNTVLNTIVGLHYAENPTISSDAAIPHYWINVGFYGGPVLYLAFEPTVIDTLSVDPQTAFSKNRKPFAWTGFFETTAPNGKNIIILAQTRKNPTSENPNQLINMFAAFDKETYERYKEEQGDTSVIPWMIYHDENDLGMVFSPPIGFKWAGGDLWFAKQYPNPTVAELNKQGEIFSLLSIEDQKTVVGKMKKLTTGEYAKEDYTTRIESIPPGFALKFFYPAFTSWPGGSLE